MSTILNDQNIIDRVNSMDKKLIVRFLIVFFSLIYIAILIALFVTGNSYLETSKFNKEVKGKFVTSPVCEPEKDRRNNLTGYYICKNLQISYNVNNISYTYNALNYKLTKLHVEGDEITIYYNESDPNKATISSPGASFIIAIGFFILGVGVLVTPPIAYILNKNKTKVYPA